MDKNDTEKTMQATIENIWTAHVIKWRDWVRDNLHLLNAHKEKSTEDKPELARRKTPQQINDEFDEGKLALRKVKQWRVQDAQKHYAWTIEKIWTAYHEGMAELKEKRQTALAQCTQEDGKECPSAAVQPNKSTVKSMEKQ